MNKFCTSVRRCQQFYTDKKGTKCLTSAPVASLGKRTTKFCDFPEVLFDGHNITCEDLFFGQRIYHLHTHIKDASESVSVVLIVSLSVFVAYT